VRCRRQRTRSTAESLEIGNRATQANFTLKWTSIIFLRRS
jgi:hypothetical protein